MISLSPLEQKGEVVGRPYAGYGRQIGAGAVLVMASGGAHLYLASHHDLAIPPLRWLATLYDIGIWAWVVVLALVLGQRLNRVMRLDTDHWLERVVYGLGSGFAALSLLYSGLAFGGLTSAWTVDFLWVGLTTWLSRDLLRCYQHAVLSLRENGLGRWKVKGQGYLAMIVACAVAGLLEVSLIGLTPPTNYDSLMYHMVGPQLLLTTHHLAVVPAVAQLNFPLGLDILWLPCLALGSDVAAHLLATSFVLFAALAVLVIGRRVGGWPCGWLSAAFFVLQPVILVSAGYVAADVGLAFYCALAMGALLRAWDSERAMPVGDMAVGDMAASRAARGWSWLVASGLYAGLSLSVKYTALAVVVMVAAAALGVPRKGAGWGERLRALALVGGTTTVVGAPWYLKNGIALGNPFYPFHAQALVSLVWTSVISHILPHSPSQTGGAGAAGTTVASLASGPGHSLTDLIHLPLTLLLHQEVFTLVDPSLIFAVCVLLLPVALWRGTTGVRLLALATLGGLAFWALGVWELRYAFPIFGALSLVGGWAVAGLFGARDPRTSIKTIGQEMRRAGSRPANSRPMSLSPLGVATQYIIVGVCILSWLAAVSGLQQIHHILPLNGQSPVGYLAGVESQTSYVAANVDQYRAVQWMNANLPPDAPVAYLWDERSYLSSARNITFLPRDTSFPPRLANERAMTAWVRSWGPRYLFVDAAMLQLYVQVYSPADAKVATYFRQVFDPFRRHYLKLLYTDRTFQVYRILDS